jgi:hypothetical protein
MRNLIRNEEGWAVLTAMVIISLMLSLGVATFAYVDNQTRQSGEERIEESSFNLTEAAIQQQGYVLSGRWPGSATLAYPSQCTEGTAATEQRCPNPSNLANATGSGSFSAPDFKTDTTWVTEVRDNGDPPSDIFTAATRTASCTGGGPGPCTGDANGDGRLWVRGEATVRGARRAIVALLDRELFQEPFPRNTITAGYFQTSNSGNKVIVDTTGSQVVVRCTTSTPGTGSDSCLGYDAAKGQLSPAGATVQNPHTPSAMSADQVDRFRTAAQTASPSTYHTSCPASLTGAVVFIELASDATLCKYNSNDTFNTESKPGVVIMTRGQLEILGNVTYYGLIYHAKQGNNCGILVTVHGNGDVQGGVSVDGCGGVQGGSSKQNITYRANAFNNLVTFGTAGLRQNTWRELPPGL